MNLAQIEAFVMIANNRSFSRTARELLLTQPTVSAYITNLESELGVQLFVRSAKTVELTEEGKKVYLYSRELVEESEKARNLFRPQRQADVSRELIIAASSICAKYLLPPYLAEYARLYPQTSFRVLETDNESVVAEVAAHKAALGFTGGVKAHSRCVFIPIFRDELLLVTPNTPKYRKIRKSGTSFDWIRNERFVLREDGTGTRQNAMKCLRTVGIEEEKLNEIATFTTPDAVLSCVREGLGISFSSRLAAQARIDHGEVLCFPLSEESLFQDLYLITSAQHKISDQAHDMIQLVQEFRPRQASAPETPQP